MINCRTSWFGFFGSKPASDSSPQKSQDGSPSTKPAIAEEGSAAGEGRSRDRRTTETSTTTSSSQCSTSDPEGALSGPPNPKKKKAYKKTLRLSTDLIVSDLNVLLKQLFFR